MLTKPAHLQIFVFCSYRKTGKTKKGKKQKEDQPIAKGTLKYSAQKLYKEGVVLEIEGLPQGQ